MSDCDCPALFVKALCTIASFLSQATAKRNNCGRFDMTRTTTVHGPTLFFCTGFVLAPLFDRMR